MPNYRYRPIVDVVADVYKMNTNRDIYEALGQVDFSKAKLLVMADTPEESEKIRSGFTDLRMWELEHVED